MNTPQKKRDDLFLCIRVSGFFFCVCVLHFALYVILQRVFIRGECRSGLRRLSPIAARFL